MHFQILLALAVTSNPVLAGRILVEISNEYKVSGGPGDELGFSVSLDSDMAALGAPSFQSSFTWVHVYERISGQWQIAAFLEPSDSQEIDDFGLSVSLDGNCLAVGAPRRDTIAADAGAVYIFDRDTNTGEWFEFQILAPNDLSSGAQFGYHVDLQDGMLFVGAPSQDNFRGAVYVYKWVDDSWVQVQKLSPSNGSYFGFSLSRNGDTALIGSFGENGIRGAAYVYRFNGTEWVQGQRLIAPDRSPDDAFGVGVAIDGDLIVVGAPGDQIDKFWEAGSAYVFRNINGTWTFEQKITQPEPSYENNFGLEMDIHERVLYVSSFERFFVHAQGALYTFEHDGTEWVNTLRLVPSDAVPPTYGGQGFGASIDVDGNTLLAGAYRDDTNGTNSGAGYFYTIGPESEAELTDAAVTFGTHLSGGLAELLTSDDQWFRARSRVGFASVTSNLLDMTVGAETTNLSAEEIDLSVEGHLSRNGGTCTLRLRKWTTNQFVQVHQYSTGLSETTEEIVGIDNADFIRMADGRIELSIRQSALSTFAVAGFDSFTDRVIITPR